MKELVGRWLRELDRIIRGEATRPRALLEGGGIDIAPGGVAVMIGVLGIIYGLCMGSYAVFKGSDGVNFLQVIASGVKVPLLLFLTFVVTFPSLYVFNALVGSRLSVGSILRLLIAGMAVMGALLASFGPIVAFFSASTTSYAFMQLLNVAVFGIAGFLGLRYLLTTLHRLTVASAPPPEIPQPDTPVLAATPSAPAAPIGTPGALDTTGEAMGKEVLTVFRVWIVLFGLVGAQMAWVLRPFLGAPGVPFTWFRMKESNFFESVLHSLGNLFNGG